MRLPVGTNEGSGSTELAALRPDETYETYETHRSHPIAELRAQSSPLPQSVRDNRSPYCAASNKNQVRRSVSSIQFSIKLAVATSLCRSQISWVERKNFVNC